MKSPFEDVNPLQSQPAMKSEPVAGTEPKAKSDATPDSVKAIFAANAQVNAPQRVVAKAPAETPTEQAAATATGYKPSGRVGALMPLMFLVWAPLAAALCGFLYSLMTGFFNPFVIGECLLGFLLGLTLWPAIRLGKCRNVKVAVALGIVAALWTYFAYLVADAVAAREDYAQAATQYVAQRFQMPAPQARALVEARLTPVRYFKLYMEERAASGVSLHDEKDARVRGVASSGGMQFSGVGYWLLMAGQVVLIALLAAGVTANAAGGRYSEEQDRWYRKKSLYSVNPADVTPLLALARSGRWKEAGALAKASKTGGAIGVVVTVYDLPPQGGGFVEITAGVENKTHRLFEAPVTVEEIRQLRQRAS